MKTPKFKVEDKVFLKRPTLHKETEGVIKEVEKVYAETMNGGLFDEDGLHIRESDIRNIQIPHEFKDDVLKITYDDNNRTKTYTFFGYAYTIVTPKMCSIYPESALKLLKKTLGATKALEAINNAKNIKP